MTEHDLHITICNPTYNESVSLQFLDILLDETLLYDSTIYVPTACFETVSTRNHRCALPQSIRSFLLRMHRLTWSNTVYFLPHPNQSRLIP